MLCRLVVNGGGLGRLAIAMLSAVSAASRYFSIRKDDVWFAAPALSNPSAEPSSGNCSLRLM